MSATRTPVALFIFNRPEVTRRLIRALAAVQPRQLLIVADGPRTDRPLEAERCAEARAVLGDVDWPCDIRTHFSHVNLGCRMRVASGLDWVFSQSDRAIVLEDDCIPDASFFPYCEELLERYRDEERVQMIRGTNLLRGRRFSSDSYYFSRMYNIWGWASWSRVWRHYDIEMSRWPGLRDSGWLETKLAQPHALKLVRWFFDETYAGRVDTWDYAFVLSGWIRDALAIVPETNLIHNAGFGEDATHTRGAGHWLGRLDSEALRFPLRHPANVQLLEQADLHELSQVYPQADGKQGLLQGVRRRLRRVLRLS